MTSGLRVVVTGATGNVGTSMVQTLADDPRTASILGLARRTPDLSVAKTEWAALDLSDDGCTRELADHIAGADAVVHLAWRFQPTHAPAVTWQANVLGSLRVQAAVAATGVPALVHASSVGAYSPGPPDGRPVDETWPTHGWPGAAYCREKAYLERALDGYEQQHPQVRVVRMRPAFLFKEGSASEQRRIFGGRFLPGPLIRPDLLPVVPTVRGLRFQALHTDDAARAYASAVFSGVSGAFNLAAEPVIGPAQLGDLLHARIAELPPNAVRAALSAGWHVRAVPASPDLFDAVLRLPVLDCMRAHEELDWRPDHTSVEAVAAFLRGVRQGSGLPTPPLTGRLAG